MVAVPGQERYLCRRVKARCFLYLLRTLLLAHCKAYSPFSLHLARRYDTFTNWEFWWPGFPVLVYFKETQTKPEGQVHFFPIIAVSFVVAYEPITHVALCMGDGQRRAHIRKRMIRRWVMHGTVLSHASPGCPRVPCLENGKRLYDVMKERCGSSKGSA